jgi:preprotein translocase subunit SecD
MTIKAKQYFGLLGVILLAVSALWIVYPKGSKINLKPLKIPFEKTFKVNLGLDLQGGSHLVYLADFKSIPEGDRPESLNGIRDVIERRVNSFGVSEPLVAISGNDKIIVELPGIKDVNEAIKLIGETPLLEFRTQNPEQKPITPDENGNVVLNPLEAWLPTKLSGKQLKRATVDFQQSSGLVNEVVVSLEFNDEGKELFAKITSENLQKPVAIVLDGEIISAPVV